MKIKFHLPALWGGRELETCLSKTVNAGRVAGHGPAYESTLQLKMFLDRGYSNVKLLEFFIFLKHQSLNDIFTDLQKKKRKAT